MMKKQDGLDGLDGLVDEVLSASSVNQEEINRIAESPFLYSRIRVRIREEKKLHSETDFFWSELFATFKLSAKIMTVLAFVVIGFFILQPSPTTRLSKEPASTEQTQPATDINALSNEELFSETIGLQNDARLRDEVKP